MKCVICGAPSSVCIWRHWLCLNCSNAQFAAVSGRDDTEAFTAAWVTQQRKARQANKTSPNFNERPSTRAEVAK